MITPRIRTHRWTALAACCLAPLALAACTPASATTATGTATTKPAALPNCRPPAADGLPHSEGSLTQTDTGTYCLGVGKLLNVFLTAPATSTARWSEIQITDTSVLAYGNNGVLTAMRDETPGVIVGKSRGVSTVTSTLPDGQTWTATIVVS